MSFPTLIAMGFGYAITRSRARTEAGRSALGAGPDSSWSLVGAVTAMIPVSLGLGLGALHLLSAADRQSLLLYRRRAGGGRLLDLGRADVDQPRGLEADNPGRPVPLAMFANVAGSYLWGWTAVGAALELMFQIIPVALGLQSTIDAGLARVLFSWTLHAIVYFWLVPTYIAYYTICAAGDRRQALQRCDGADFLHPVPGGGDADRHPPHSSPIRRSAPASSSFIRCSPRWWRCRRLLTVFTICASVEIASRLRGGNGAVRLADGVCPGTTRSCWRPRSRFVMLGFGGAGGLINMSYQLDATIHNTQWITGHFHLIFGGAIVIMYFAIAYDLWPHLTGRALARSSA